MLQAHAVHLPECASPDVSFSSVLRLTRLSVCAVEGLVSNALGGRKLSCTYPEFQIVVPPAGQQCLDYLSQYNAIAGSYAEVQPNGDCGLCTYGSGDAFLRTLNMSAWRRFRSPFFPFARDAYGDCS